MGSTRIGREKLKKCLPPGLQAWVGARCNWDFLRSDPHGRKPGMQQVLKQLPLCSLGIFLSALFPPLQKKKTKTQKPKTMHHPGPWGVCPAEAAGIRVQHLCSIESQLFLCQGPWREGITDHWTFGGVRNGVSVLTLSLFVSVGTLKWLMTSILLLVDLWTLALLRTLA